MFALIAAVAIYFLYTKRAAADVPLTVAVAAQVQPLPSNVVATTAQAANQQIAALSNVGNEVATAAGGIATSILMASGVAGPVGLAIGAAVAAAITIVNKLRGTAHLDANAFGNSVQVPLSAQFAQIIDAHDQAMADGSETSAGASAALQAVQYVWSEYVTAGQQYAAQGKDQAKVVSQGLATMNFIPSISIPKIQAQIVQLQQAGR